MAANRRRRNMYPPSEGQRSAHWTLISCDVGEQIIVTVLCLVLLSEHRSVTGTDGSEQFWTPTHHVDTNDPTVSSGSPTFTRTGTVCSSSIREKKKKVLPDTSSRGHTEPT
ncbi:hypothetical protein GOODEAATRI_029250 [Goodea atripinnis]|uniref:Uncharacterized protein n=1 Tax=Goodea atripinnis TaxID=208336 RepID=A0ABV0P272_9TELE